MHVFIRAYTAEHDAARRWCSAVTNWRKMGQWKLLVSKSPGEIQDNLAYLVHMMSRELVPA
jgi:hypothetical protein